METKEIKSEFLKKVGDFARELQKDCKNENVKRGFIFIASETSKKGEEHDDNTRILVRFGNGYEICKCISSYLASENPVRETFKSGIKLAAIEARDN